MPLGPWPLLLLPRVLVPGTAATLPGTHGRVGPGARVLAAFRATGGGEAAVATEAEVEAVQPLGDGVLLFRLAGRGLLRVLNRQEGEGGPWAWGGVLEEPGEGADGLIAPVERALRRYQGLRAEAGEPIGALVGLSRDPVEASHEVASHLRISWPEVQDLLEAGSAAQRLQRAGAVLERETGLLERLLSGGGG